MQLDDWLRVQAIQHDDRVVVVSLRGMAAAFNLLDAAVLDEWAARLRGSSYLILDRLRPVLDAIGLDEHTEGGRFLVAFDTLLRQADVSDACIVQHGHSGERSRGDSRFRDWPDVEWRMVRER